MTHCSRSRPRRSRRRRFEDKTVKPGVRYVYAIVAVDRRRRPTRSAPSNRVRGNRAMKRFFRIELQGHAAPRRRATTASWRLLEGDLFGEHEAGDASRARPAHRLLAPVVPSKIVARRPQLQGSRGGAEQAAADRAADLHQAVDGGHRSRAITIVLPGGRRPRRPRGGGRRRDRRARAATCREADAHRLRLRHHVRQRRHRARAAEEGRPVHAREGVRHLRAARARASRRASTTTRRTASASRAGSTATRRQIVVDAAS